MLRWVHDAASSPASSRSSRRATARAGPRRSPSISPAGSSTKPGAARVAVLPQAAAPGPRSSTARTITAPGCSSTRRRNGSLLGVPGRRIRSSRSATTQSSRCRSLGATRPARTRAGRRAAACSAVTASTSARRPALGRLATQPGLVDREAQLTLALDRRADQAREQRVRPGRARAQLGVGLGGDVVGVHLARQLDELDQVEVRVGAGEDQAGLLELVAVGVVDLVAVPVALLDPRLAVGLADHRARGQLGRVEAQAHRAAQVARALDEGLLLLHRGDHRLGAVGVELGGGGLLQPGHGAGVLDHHALQPQAQPQGRDAVGAGVGQRAELALDAADAEAAGHADRVDVLEVLARRRPGSSHSSEATQRRLTLASWAKPPARSASATER